MKTALYVIAACMVVLTIATLVTPASVGIYSAGVAKSAIYQQVANEIARGW